MPPEILQLLQTAFMLKHFAKSSVIIRQEQICRELFFVSKGLIKVVSCCGEREFILRFFPENSFVTIVDSFTEQCPSRFQLVAMEDCDLRALHYTRFEEICANSHIVANHFRKINQWVSANM